MRKILSFVSLVPDDWKSRLNEQSPRKRTAGFLPRNLIKKETNKTNKKYYFKINQLLYSGGLKPYIQELFSLEIRKSAVEILGQKEVEEIEILNSYRFFKP